MLNTEETIVAIASPTTPSVRGIIRLSGDSALQVVDKVCVAPEENFTRCQIERLNVGSGFGIVEADVLRWPTSQSYTGQPCVEIHTHGSLPLLNALVSTLLQAGARAAKPGEFTMRAFLAGRLDLTQAEAVLGVIDAEQRGTLDHALRQLAGNVSKPLESLRDNLLNLLADVEAGLDFVDEDIEFISRSDLSERLQQIESELIQTSQTLSARQGLTGRRKVVLFGAPNVGKSQLANAIAGRSVALVANLAGTTRDAVTIDLDLDGHPIRLVDTAGVEDEMPSNDSTSQSSLEDLDRLAQQSSQEAVGTADIGLLCQNLAERRDAKPINWSRYTRRSTQIIHVGTKLDQVDDQSRSKTRTGMILTSSLNGDGIDELRNAIVGQIQQTDREQTGSVLGTAARCEESLRRALSAIQSARRNVESEAGQEFVAEDLRITTEAIGEMTGAVYTDDVLDRVFGRFCIGK